MQARRYMTPEQAAELGKLDPEAIERVRSEAWPRRCNADELHDALVLLGFVTAAEGAAWARAVRALARRRPRDRRRVAARRRRMGQRRAVARRSSVALPGAVAAEQLAVLGAAAPSIATLRCASSCAAASRRSGPSRPRRSRGRSASRARRRAAGARRARAARRGDARQLHVGCKRRAGEEWCERRLLARIHRYTLKRLRNEIEPATLADYQRFLFHWQGLGARAPPRARGAQRRARRAARLGVAGRRSGSARSCRRASRTTVRRCSISCARPARSSGGGRGRAARSPAPARRPSRRRRSRSCRAARCRCGARSARTSRCKACRVPRSASSTRCATAARCSSSRSCRRAACCACRSRRRSASSSRAAS